MIARSNGSIIGPRNDVSGSSGSGIWDIGSQFILNEQGEWPKILPLPYSSNLVMWFDSSDRSTLFDAVEGGSLVADNGRVARWEDKSITGAHLTQTDVNRQPLVRYDEINKLTAIEFDGAALPNDDQMSTTIYGSPNGLSAITIIAVARPVAEPTTLPSLGRLLVGWMENGSWGGVGVQLLSRIAGWRFGTSVAGSQGYWNFIGDRTDKPTVVASVKNQGNDFFRVNGDQVGAFTNMGTTLANTSSKFQVYGRSEYNAIVGGFMGEILVYEEALSEENLTAVENYLKIKWKVPPGPVYAA